MESLRSYSPCGVSVAWVAAASDHRVLSAIDATPRSMSGGAAIVRADLFSRIC